MSLDFAGYDEIVELACKRRIDQLRGDLVEIGAYMGGGTVKLARFARGCSKKVYAIDTFNPELDVTVSPRGVVAGDVYRAFLTGLSMLEAFRESIRGYDNVTTLIGDSRTASFPSGQEFCLGYIDGCHSRDFVLSDFALVWERLVPGGILAVHDYNFQDWPEVTEAVDEILENWRTSIAETLEIRDRHNILSKVMVKN